MMLQRYTYSPPARETRKAVKGLMLVGSSWFIWRKPGYGGARSLSFHPQLCKKMFDTAAGCCNSCFLQIKKTNIRCFYKVEHLLTPEPRKEESQSGWIQIATITMTIYNIVTTVEQQTLLERCNDDTNDRSNMSVMAHVG